MIWSERKNSYMLYGGNESPDQTAQKRSLTWAFVAANRRLMQIFIFKKCLFFFLFLELTKMVDIEKNFVIINIISGGWCLPLPLDYIHM